MKTTTRALTLRLKPENDGRVSLSLTGRVHEEKMHGRASLLAMASLWIRPEPLNVVLSADVSGSWCWAEDWMEALLDEVGGCEVRFVSEHRQAQAGGPRCLEAASTGATAHLAAHAVRDEAEDTHRRDARTDRARGA